jgi:NET1-associated nuclear protein 1 (U3 small nucleolar RNA-associated protein 17)
MDANSDTDGLKKRKRAKSDVHEERPSRKKRSSRSKRHSESHKRQNANQKDTQKDTQNNAPNSDRPKKPGDQDLNAAAEDMQLVREQSTGNELELANLPVSWHLSKPIGGRILDIDPIFSVDEEYAPL